MWAQPETLSVEKAERVSRMDQQNQAEGDQSKRAQQAANHNSLYRRLPSRSHFPPPLRGAFHSPACGGANIVRVAGFPAWAGQGGGCPPARYALAGVSEAGEDASWPAG